MLDMLEEMLYTPTLSEDVLTIEEILTEELNQSNLMKELIK
jgi:hypothetical protein